MALVKKDVVIDEETFYLDKIPDAETALVLHAKDALLGAVDLKGLVTDLSKLGSFIRVAYNGVAGHTELQIKVQRVGYKITKLADKSAVTVHSFKTTSRDVLQELQGTYEYLLDGLEDMALATLSGLAALAEKMAKASEELHNGFDAATGDVESALEDTQTAKGTEEERKKELEKEKEEYEKELKKAKQQKRDADEAERKAEKMYYEAQKRLDQAYHDQRDDQRNFVSLIADGMSSVMRAGVSAVTLNFGKTLEEISKIGENSAYKEAIEEARKEKINHLETMKKQQDMRREANQQCIEFAERIKNCQSDDELAQVAVDALHKSVGALKSLSVIMMNAALFWKQMQTHCEALAGEEIKIQIETAVENYDETKRIKTWTSSAFKKKAINYYAKWVALGEVCGNYMQQIRDTRTDLYKYLEENPTIEQSRRNVRELAITFVEDLKKAQDDINKENRKTDQEIKELKQ